MTLFFAGKEYPPSGLTLLPELRSNTARSPGSSRGGGGNCFPSLFPLLRGQLAPSPTGSFFTPRERGARSSPVPPPSAPRLRSSLLLLKESCLLFSKGPGNPGAFFLIFCFSLQTPRWDFSLVAHSRFLLLPQNGGLPFPLHVVYVLMASIFSHRKRKPQSVFSSSLVRRTDGVLLGTTPVLFRGNWCSLSFGEGNPLSAKRFPVPLKSFLGTCSLMAVGHGHFYPL